MLFKSILHLHRAYKISWNGLKNAWLYQLAFRIEVIALLVAIPCTFYVGNNAVEYVLLFSSVLLILVTELINSAIETTVNRISMEFHELSGLAKDLASAGVFVAILNMVITWAIIVFL